MRVVSCGGVMAGGTRRCRFRRRATTRSLVSPTGWTPRKYYELRGPYRKPEKQVEPAAKEELAS